MRKMFSSMIEKKKNVNQLNIMMNLKKNLIVVINVFLILIKMKILAQGRIKNVLI